ncbi:MAG: TraR/DksA family transcriptional regulator [Hyphomicrobiaceae bacterium]
MTQRDLRLYREMLIDRREEIKSLQDISEQSRSAVELDQASVGRVSRVDALQAQQMALAVERQRTKELHRIAGALSRIDDGTYGDCVVCGEDIAAKRLELDPSIPTCITCARANA